MRGLALALLLLGSKLGPTRYTQAGAELLNQGEAPVYGTLVRAVCRALGVGLRVLRGHWALVEKFQCAQANSLSLEPTHVQGIRTGSNVWHAGLTKNQCGNHHAHQPRPQQDRMVERMSCGYNGLLVGMFPPTLTVLNMDYTSPYCNPNQGLLVQGGASQAVGVGVITKHIK